MCIVILYLCIITYYMFISMLLILNELYFYTYLTNDRIHLNIICTVAMYRIIWPYTPHTFVYNMPTQAAPLVVIPKIKEKETRIKPIPTVVFLFNLLTYYSHLCYRTEHMKIIVGCEFTGTVRDAFRALGHEAYSCDLLPTESHPEWHYQGDLLTAPQLETFDLAIFFPPCTHICVSGARWFKEKQAEQQEAIDFFMFCANLPIKRIAIENPIGIMSTRWRKPDQIIQPWMFGHTESKATCIWLKGLKPLQPTNNVYEAMMKLPLKERTRIHYASPGPDRGKDRSRTYQGIASAMTQWAI